MSLQQPETAEGICWLTSAVVQEPGAVHAGKVSLAGMLRSGFVRADAILKHRSVGT